MILIWFAQFRLSLVAPIHSPWTNKLIIYKDNDYNNIVNEDSPSRNCIMRTKEEDENHFAFYERGNEGMDTDLGTTMIGEYD